MKKFITLISLLCLASLLAGCTRHDEVSERNSLNGMLLGEHYEQLDRSLEEVRTQYTAGELSSNAWADRFHTLASLNGKFTSKFDEWVRATNSGFAHLARGMHLQQLAWHARGNQPAADTSDRQFEAMRSLARQAREDLLAANQKMANCALCAGELINNNRALEDNTASRELLDTALRQDQKMWWPVLAYYQGIYPNWDSYDDVAAFINEMRGKVNDPALIANMESRMFRDRARQALLRTSIDSLKTAMSLYEMGVNEQPHSLLLKELADIYIKQGNYQRASELLERDLQVNALSDIATMEKLVDTYFSIGQVRKGNEVMARRAELTRRYQFIYIE